ncbi:MAG: HAD family hydrolase [Alphaproteobacteria bacterium]|nr:HAD family hydrolase [Alphaproteobacteria bacterium]
MSSSATNLVVFDWNGTLLADTNACINATNVVLERLGLSPVSRRRYQDLYTMPLDKFYENLGVDEDLLAVHEATIHPLWHDVYSAAPIRLRRGARDALRAIKRAPCKTVVLSNYLVDKIERQARQFGIADHFDDILAFTPLDDLYRRAGKGPRLKNYLTASPVRRSIIVGDTEEEIAIGKKLGMTTVSITDGTCSRARLKAAGPDFLIASLNELTSIVDELFDNSSISRGGRA